VVYYYNLVLITWSERIINVVVFNNLNKIICSVSCTCSLFGFDSNEYTSNIRLIKYG